MNWSTNESEIGILGFSFIYLCSKRFFFQISWSSSASSLENDDYFDRVVIIFKYRIWLFVMYIFTRMYIACVCDCVRKRERERERERVRGTFNKLPDFFVQAFKIVVDSWKFSMLLLYILWDDWPFLWFQVQMNSYSSN